MKTRKLTCIVCPRGCELTVTVNDDSAVESVVGQSCPRGKSYAISECTNPQRVITSTVATEDNAVIPVKTSQAVAKSAIFDIMDEISRIVAPKDARIGSVLVKNILGSGADLVVTGKK